MTDFYTCSEAYETEIYEKGAVGRVQVDFAVSATQLPALEKSLRTYFATLEQMDAETAAGFEGDETFYSGGWAYHVTWRSGQQPLIVLASAGLDACSSLSFASQYLLEAIEEDLPGLEVTFTELPTRPASA
ncbi:MAG: hypothetical protein Q3965_01090 [Rothia sp. (in: high G+C Gram-positive bacteria)]|nr:hypothetical protein [Rothia sp. (in: high G+C Gram-positive bacteria)]